MVSHLLAPLDLQNRHLLVPALHLFLVHTYESLKYLLDGESAFTNTLDHVENVKNNTKSTLNIFSFLLSPLLLLSF